MNEIMLAKAWKSSENIYIITLLVVYYAEYQSKCNNPLKETDRICLFFKGGKISIYKFLNSNHKN